MQIYTRQVEVSGAMPIPGIYYRNFHDLLLSESSEFTFSSSHSSLFREDTTSSLREGGHLLLNASKDWITKKSSISFLFVKCCSIN